MDRLVCQIEMLGGLRVLRGDEIIADEVGSGTRARLPHRVSLLLACLALRPGEPLPREIIAERLWPDQPPTQTRNSLSTTLSLLRRHLEALDDFAPTPDGIFIANRDQIGLDRALVTTDVGRFESLLDAAREAQNRKGAASPAARAALLEQALSLYRGDLLPGYYEDWVDAEREQFRTQRLEALRRLAQSWDAAGDHDAAARAAQKAVEADSLNEEAHHLLIQSLAAAGRPAAALTAYARMEAIFEKELGIAPPEATQRLVRQLRSAPPVPAVAPPAPPTTPAPPIDLVGEENEGERDTEEPAGGAVPLGSPYYVARPVDARFFAALKRRDSIVLVKGARQAGKTSLLARGLQQARESGARIALTDFDALGDAALSSAESLFQTLAILLADELELDDDPQTDWSAERGPAMNLERFVQRKTLKKDFPPLVWGLDNVDRLFTYPFSDEVFGLFRSWHNRRSLDPSGPWSRLTLAIAYATEAHLFITDLNQSPFNVGTRLTIEDFTPLQLKELTEKRGVGDAAGGLFALVGGQPYLAQRGLDEIARHEAQTPGAGAILLQTMSAETVGEDSIFGDHLRRLRRALERDNRLYDIVRGLLRGEPCPTEDDLYRLRSAGVLIGETVSAARFRCPLYERYFARHLPP